MDDSVLDTIGSPLVRVDSPAGATVAVKLESRNPGGSAKDRPALRMIERAEAAGEIEPGDALVEPTSGNTGIGLAMVGAAKGYDVTVVMPASKSQERRQIMAAYGADLELVDGDIDDAKARADELEAEGMVQLRQFENRANPEAHYETTAVEILDQLDERTPDALVAGVGTGGTITGIGRRLREEFPAMDVVAVEPEDSAVLSGEEPTADSFQGMGPGFVSPNLDADLLDGVLTVGVDEAEAECRRLAREEGILVGQSSGGSNVRARDVAEAFVAGDDPDYDPIAVDGWEPRPDAGVAGDDPLVLTVFWDSGERYMSTGLYG
ncbi:PLP-dependent cysteine synthase family protein [Halobaculum sp. CBA1158]|uniref:PLP-dependent cysteine synthase family protein n=1 Tax=Halobaculum sp. CBA1158 TaxID=2904243 RepID=UPI001F432063|nr:PLP-dependent cysteine synthase family protein [Halobaculum sp. CBA1158]UIO98854.1 PLP-dependent cysteine synthase family protein [Halobaculum sp. CBA1158]